MTDALFFLQDLAVILISAALGGYICRLAGLSSVVGYITAGLVVGTPEIAFPYISNEERIEIIAQLGVVFLMFSIGLQFRLQRVRELGFRVIISTTLGALLILSTVRLLADIIGLPMASGIALAAVFMNSSSAIISKIIQETGIGHERHGQLALGTTLLEDIVSVVMLAVLGSYIVIEGSDSRAGGPFATIALLVGFAILVFVVGALIAPRLLRKIGGDNNSEAISVLVAGFLLFTALLSVYAGFSLALGAFLFGMIIAETRQKPMVERSFQGLKDIFLTIFFVTIGMMVDIHSIPGAMKWIVLGIMGALLGRPVAAFLSLLLMSEHPRTALRAALCLTPLGEFSFIIAGVAVAGGLFPESFQAAVVGTVLGTSLLSPLIAANGDRLSRFLAEGKLPAIDRAHAAYSQFWHLWNVGEPGKFLWLLLRKRIVQITVELVLVSTLLIFAGKIYETLEKKLPGFFALGWAPVTYWTILGVLVLIPLVAIWRNLSATTLIITDFVGERQPKARSSLRILSTGLQSFFALLLGIWLWNVLPAEVPKGLIFGLAVLLVLPLVFLAWRSIIRIHSEMEWALDQNLRTSSRLSSRHLFDNWKDEDWDLNLKEFLLPDDSPLAGKTLQELALRKSTGCSVVGIQRHGFSLVSVGPTTHLFPGDDLLLLGSDEQLRQAQTLLSQKGESAPAQQNLESQILKSYKIPEDSKVVGRTLAELNWSRIFGVQVVAQMRGNVTQTGLDAKTRIESGDTLLLLGTASAMENLADAVEEG